MDDKIASLVWLIKVAEPMTEGPYKGRLRVPVDLVGYACSDILAAFELCRADVKVVAPLFRQLLTVEVQALPDRSSWREGDDLPRALEGIARKGNDLRRRGVKVSTGAKYSHVLLKLRLAEYSDLDEKVIEYRQFQREEIKQTRKIHEEAEEVLADGLEEYVIALQRERLTTPRMVYYRQHVLLPLLNLCVLTGCPAWDTKAEAEDTWRRMRDWKGSFEVGRGAVPVFSPKGEFCALIDKTGVAIVEAATWTVLARLPASTVTQVRWSPANVLTFLADGKPVRSEGDERPSKLIEFPVPKLLKEVAAISPDGKTIASGSKGLVKLVDVSTGRKRHLRSRAVATAEPTCLGFSSDGRTVTTAWPNVIVDIEKHRGADLKTGEGETNDPVRDRFNASLVHLGPSIEVWNADTGDSVAFYRLADVKPTGVTSLAFSHRGLLALYLSRRIVVMGDGTNKVEGILLDHEDCAAIDKVLLDIAKGGIRAFAIDEGFTACSFLKDGLTLAVRGSDNSCQLLNVAGRQLPWIAGGSNLRVIAESGRTSLQDILSVDVIERLFKNPPTPRK